jgi:hypothetical protein
MPNLRHLDTNDYYPRDIREFDPRKCFRLWSNGQLGPITTSTTTGVATSGGGHNTGNFHLSNNYSDTNASGVRICDIERSSAYSGEVTPFFTLVGKNIVSGDPPASRAWLSDRCTPVNPKMVAGMFEMDSYARVRYRGGAADHDFVPRIGFSQGHNTFDVNDTQTDFQNAICFTCSRSEQTWRTHTNAAFAVTDPGPPVIETGSRVRTDTGIRVDEWHTLGVWVNAAGTQVKYYIDGRCVEVVNGREKIPNKFTNPLFVEGSVNTSSTGTAIGGGVALRGTGIITTNTPRLDIQWCVIRVFMDRP